MAEIDEAWSPVRRETLIDIQHRINVFLQELSERPERNIVVVSHGVWIECCLHAQCPEALDHGKRRVHNCNIFVGECVSRDGKFVRLQNVHPIH
jgi:broad specificity phosphatase PhoE